MKVVSPPVHRGRPPPADRVAIRLDAQPPARRKHRLCLSVLALQGFDRVFGCVVWAVQRKKPFPHIPQGPQRSRPPQGHPPQPPNEVERPQQHRRPSTGASATSAIVSIPAALGQDTLAAGVRTSRYMRILIHY